MELPFAVESPERTSQLLASSSTTDLADDGSSLVTTSSQGSFLGSSSGTGGAFSSHSPQTLNAAVAVTNTPMNNNNNTPIMRPSPPVLRSQPQVPTVNPPLRNLGPAPIVSPRTPAPVPAPSTRSTGVGSGIVSGLNIFGSLRVPGMPSVLSSRSRSKPQQHHQQQTEIVDFTYVNVFETDADEVDITLDGQHAAMMQGLQGAFGGGGGEDENHPEMRGDILTILLSGAAQQENSTNETLVRQCEEANQAANQASEAKREGDLQGALEAHAQAAKQFREAAVLIKDRNASMANSLLLLSQTQAKSALALKRIVRQQASPHDHSNGSDPKNPRSKIITQKDRLRAAVRGALVTRNEEEMSDSAFLGRASKGPMASTGSSLQIADTSVRTTSAQSATNVPGANIVSHNPVDDMMELERELRDMDMALELGNSIASLDARTQSRLKNSISVDGSFMVVPPGSQSYMSSSGMWTPSPGPSSTSTNVRGNNKQTQGRTTAAPGTAGVRARANRVQNKLGASTNHPRSSSHTQLGVQQQQTAQQHGLGASSRNPTAGAPPQGLDASWWGNSSTTSQMLTSSVISLGASSSITTRGGHGGGEGMGGASNPNSSANTKQIMRLMDALKTLGDENANLLREVEDAEAARMEAKAAKEQMAKFKSDYGTRFAHLKGALAKFREAHPESGPGNEDPNPVINSEFMRSASTSEQLQRQEQLIRKLTADLKKEKEESKKKDQALRKYESFYREVKARSAQKAAQRQREGAVTSHRPPPAHGRKSGQR